MFAPAYPSNNVAYGAEQGVANGKWRGHGTKDTTRWHGPNGGGFLGHLFTKGVHGYEREVYEMKHTGAGGALGFDRFWTKAPYAPCPKSGRMIQARSGPDGNGLYEYIVADTEYVADLSAQENAQAEHRRAAFQAYWTSNATLATVASPAFINALRAGQNGGDASMPASLRAAEATPDILRHFVPCSTEAALGHSKVDFLLATRNDGPTHGVIQTGGNRQGVAPDTHSKEPRSADAALKGVLT